MRSLDPNKKRPFQADSEATSTEDTKCSTRRSNRGSSKNPLGGQSWTPRINEEAVGDENKVITVSPQSHAQNSRLASRHKSGVEPASNVGLLGRFFGGSTRGYNFFSHDADETPSHMPVTGNAGQQTGLTSTQSRQRSDQRASNSGPSADVAAVMAQHQSRITELSAQLEEKEALYQSVLSYDAEESVKWSKMSREYQNVIDDLKNQNARLTAELAQKEAQYQWSIHDFEIQKVRMTTDWTQRESQYHHTISHLETQNSKNASAVTTLQMQLEAACADFSKELAEAKSQNSFEPVKATDTEIQVSWRNLAFSVRQFVKQYCPTSFSPLKLQELHVVSRVPELKQFCVDPALVLQSPLFSQSLLETCVWAYLYNTIFSPQADYWAGTVGKHFIATCASLHDLMTKNSRSQDSSSSLPAFHQWRSDSMHHLQRLGAIDVPTKGTLAAKMIDYLGPILDQTTKGVAKSARLNDAVDIMGAATNIDKIFRMSKAHYTVIISNSVPPSHPPFFGFRFDPSFMEQKSEFAGFGDRNGSHAAVVDLVVLPGILKAGNTDGNNYQSQQFLVKLGVVCNVQRFLNAAKVNEATAISSTSKDVSSVPSRSVHNKTAFSAEQRRESSEDDDSDVDML